MIYTLIVFIVAVICVLLTIAVLLQSGEGGGLSGIAAGGQATQMMGQRRTADFLSKATAVLGGAFLVLCLVANFFIQRGTPTTSAIQKEAAAANAAAGGLNNGPSKTQSAVPLNQAKNNAASKSAIPEPAKKGGSQKPLGH